MKKKEKENFLLRYPRIQTGIMILVGIIALYIDMTQKNGVFDFLFFSILSILIGVTIYILDVFLLIRVQKWIIDKIRKRE